MALREVPTLFGEDGVTTHNYTRVFTIDETDYLFKFSYNPRIDRWVLSIDDPNNDPVIVGAVCLNNVNLFTYANGDLRPRGVLVCIPRGTEEDISEPGEFDLGKTSFLVHYDRDEDLVESEPTEPGLA